MQKGGFLNNSFQISFLKLNRLFHVMFVLGLLHIRCAAQEGFEILIDTDMESGIAGALKDSHDNVLFTGMHYFPGQPLHSMAHITKVTPGGDTASRQFYYGEDTLCTLFRTIELNNNTYIVFGAIGKHLSNKKKCDHLWVMKLDGYLNPLWEKRYKLAGDFWNPMYEVAITADSSIYLAGYAAIDGLTHNQRLFMMKFNTNGDTLKTRYPHYSNSSKTIFGIINNADNNGVTVFGYGFHITGSTIQAIEIDSSLNYQVFPVIDPLGSDQNNITAKRVTDSTYLISGISRNYHSGSSPHYDIQLGLITGDHVFFDRRWLGRVDTNDYPAWRTSMDFTDKNNIWVSGNIEHFPSQHIDTEILVYLLDSQLNVKGMKLYGGDMNYSATTTTATSDGGCVLGCRVYDWKNSFANDLDFWIKKVYPNDIITFAEDTPYPYDRDVLVFPNPFGSALQIRTFRNNLAFALFDINGRKVIESDIQWGGNGLNTAGIPKGFYVYTISTNNRVIQTGKLVKINLLQPQ